jgi:hypothetical protein
VSNQFQLKINNNNNNIVTIFKDDYPKTAEISNYIYGEGSSLKSHQFLRYLKNILLSTKPLPDIGSFPGVKRPARGGTFVGYPQLISFP